MDAADHSEGPQRSGRREWGEKSPEQNVDWLGTA